MRNHLIFHQYSPQRKIYSQYAFNVLGPVSLLNYRFIAVGSTQNYSLINTLGMHVSRAQTDGKCLWYMGISDPFIFRFLRFSKYYNLMYPNIMVLNI
jgi:hypothetical protein